MESMPAYFSLNVHLLIFIAILLVAGFSAYYYYRRTIPPTTFRQALLLGLLRGLSIFLILFLLFRPEVTFRWDINVKKRIALLVDHSASMSLAEHEQSRLQRALAISAALRDEMSDMADVREYAFDTKLSGAATSNQDTTINGTDITESLTEVIDQFPNLDDIILLTDGNYTQGSNPLYVDKIKQVQINPIGIGDSLASADLKILNLEYNYIAYENKPVTVIANVNLFSDDSVSVQALLKQDQKTLQAQKCKVSGDGRIVPINFTFQPERLGVQRYVVELQPLNDESILDNNNASFGIEVLKGKIIVGLIASQPNYDLKFLHQTLDAFEDCETRFYISSINQGILNQVLQESDILFIQNYPYTGVGSDKIKMLGTIDKPFCYLLSERMDGSKYQFLQQHFPIKSIQMAGQSVATQVDYRETDQNSPLTDLFEHKEQNIRFWSNTPPIMYPFSTVQFSQPMATFITTLKDLPVLSGLHQNRLLFLGSGFWRWKFMLAENRDFTDGYDRFVYRIVRWLEGGKGNRNIILKMDKKIYDTGESVALLVQLYDGAYNPIDTGMVTAAIVHDRDTSEVILQSRGAGNYQAEFIPFKPGKYHLRINAWQNDVSLGRLDTEIDVLPTNNEFIYTRQAVGFLRQLAGQTGGHYFNETEAMHILKMIDLSPANKEEKITLAIWQNIYLLLFIILLLAVEWTVRKRKGLA